MQGSLKENSFIKSNAKKIYRYLKKQFYFNKFCIKRKVRMHNTHNWHKELFFTKAIHKVFFKIYLLIRY